MALVVLSERLPLQALESILRRCAYVLIPLSVVLIKYYPNLGVEYSRWAGELMWTGVTTQKNSLGQLCTLSAFLFIWALLRDWKSEKPFKTSFQTYADVLVLAIGIFLLRGPGKSYSATSGGSLIVGVTILLLLYWRTNLAKVVARHLKSIMVSFTLTFIFLYDSLVKIVAPILGRDETLTGRTDIWRPILDFASRNPIFGVGYGGFWSPDNSELEKMVGSQFILAQAHNGYIAVYVELGIVGILLLALFLLHYCDKVQRELNHSFEWGVYGICILILSMLYNNTEISFLQSSSYLWSTMVFLTVVFSASCLDTTKKEM